MSCHAASTVGRIVTRTSRRIYAFFNARYTVGRVTPNSRASAAFDSPATTRRLISATWPGLRAGLRPLYLRPFRQCDPLRLALTNNGPLKLRKRT